MSQQARYKKNRDSLAMKYIKDFKFSPLTPTTEEIEIELVKTVEKYPCLYNNTLKSFNREDKKNKAWQNVAAHVPLSPSRCKLTWRKFLTNLKKEIKERGIKFKAEPRSLTDYMKFVVPYLELKNITKKNKQKKQNMTISQRKKYTVTPRATKKEREEIETEYLDDKSTESGSNSTKSSGSNWSTASDSSSSRTLSSSNCSKQSDSSRHNSVEPTSSAKKHSLEVQEDNPPLNKETTPLRSLQQPSSSTDNSEQVKSFLNSLIPELEELNPVQFRSFKRQVLVLIDDITTNNESE